MYKTIKAALFYLIIGTYYNPFQFTISMHIFSEGVRDWLRYLRF